MIRKGAREQVRQFAPLPGPKTIVSQADVLIFQQNIFQRRLKVRSLPLRQHFRRFSDKMEYWE
jgi:hypothetical protein